MSPYSYFRQLTAPMPDANQIFLNIKSLELQMAELSHHKAEALELFKGKLLACIALRRKLFDGLAPDELHGADIEHAQLVDVASDGTLLRATFAQQFGVERVVATVELPSRYLMPDGQTQMERDAIALADVRASQGIAPLPQEQLFVLRFDNGSYNYGPSLKNGHECTFKEATRYPQSGGGIPPQRLVRCCGHSCGGYRTSPAAEK